MKNNSFVLGMTIVLAGCSNAPVDKSFTVNGLFDSEYTGTVYLKQIQDQLVTIDSVKIEGGKTFQFKPDIEYTDDYQIRTSPYVGSANFIGQQGATFHLNFDVKNRNCQLTSELSPEQDIIDRYKTMIAPYSKLAEENWKMYETVKQKNDIDSMKLLSDIGDSIFREEQRNIKDMITANRQTYAAVALSHMMFLNKYPAIKEIYEMLDTVTHAKTYDMRQLKQKLQEAKALWMEGQEAPLFTTRDMQGREVSLKQFRGKYVLLDFWASWCHSCRVKAKAIKAIYPELQQRGIVMFGVSMDDHEKAWQKASKEDQITWTNTCELKRFDKNNIAQDYKVKQLPSLFLIGPDGTIVKQDPTLAYLLDLPIRE